MTKNTKKLLGLVGALAVLGGAYGTIVLINQHNEEKKAEQSKAEKEANTFYLSQMEEPVSISYTNSYGTFAFSYDTENETWSYDSDEHFPVTQSYLTSISSDLKSFTAERKLEEVQDDLSVYGLDNPSCTITAKGSDDTEVTIQIGNLNSYNSDYYAKVEGSDDIYTIASSYVSDISNDISALQEKESFPHMMREVLSNRSYMKLIALITIWIFAVNISTPFYNVQMLGPMAMSYTEINFLATIVSNVATLLLASVWGGVMDRYGNKAFTRVFTLLAGLIPLLWLSCDLDGAGRAVPLGHDPAGHRPFRAEYVSLSGAGAQPLDVLRHLFLRDADCGRGAVVRGGRLAGG